MKTLNAVLAAVGLSGNANFYGEVTCNTAYNMQQVAAKLVALGFVNIGCEEDPHAYMLNNMQVSLAEDGLSYYAE